MPPEDAFKSPEHFWAFCTSIHPGIALAVGLLLGWCLTVMILGAREKRSGEQLVRLEILKELLRRKLDAHNALRARLHELASALTAYVGINNFAASRQQDEAAEQHKATQIAELHIRVAAVREAAESNAVYLSVAVQAAAQRLWANYIARIEQKSGTTEFDITYFTAKHRDLEQALDAEIRQIAEKGYSALLKST